MLGKKVQKRRTRKAKHAVRKYVCGGGGARHITAGSIRLVIYPRV